MADNFVANAGAGGKTFATDDVAGVDYPILKVALGALDAVTLLAGGAGAVSAGVPRVTLASDDPAVTALQVLDNAIAGNEMQVDVVAALPAGTNNIGDVDVLTLPATTVAGATVKTADLDTGAGADNVPIFGVAVGAAGGAVAVTGDATNGLDVDVTRVTGTVTVANGGTFATQVDGAALTALQLIDNIVKLEDDPHASADAGVQMLAVRKATPANVSGLDGDYEPLQVSAGRLWASATIDAALPAGTNNIGDVDVLTVPAPLSTTGGGTEATALRVTVASDSTGVLSVDDNGGSLTVDGTVTANLAAGTNNIGDVDVLSVIPGTGATNLGKAIDSAGGATDTGVPALVIRDDALAALTPIEGDYVALRVDANGALWTHDDALDAALAGTELQVDIVAALPAGANAIGKLAANSGVDIGDVDVTSIAAGTNLIGDVGIQGRTTGGLSFYKSIDLDETEEEVKATAGTLYSILAFNRTAAPLYLKFYNATAANVIVGTTVPDMTLVVPANADSDGAGFTHSVAQGYAFGTAISMAATTGVADADAGAPGVNDCVVLVGFK